MEYIEKTAKTVDEAIALALKELGLTLEEADVTVVDQGKPGVLFGLGSRPAKVRVAAKVKEPEPVESVAPAAAEPAAAEVAAEVVAPAAEEVRAAEVVEPEVVAPKKEEVPAAKAGGKKEPRKYVIDEAATEKARSFLKEVLSAMKVDGVMEKFVNAEEGSVTFRLHGDDMGILIGKHGQTLDSLQYLVNLVANKVCGERVRIIIDVEDYRDRRVETLTRLARRLADQVRREGEKVDLEAMNPHERKIIHMALQNDRRVTTFSVGEDPNRHVVIDLKR